MIGVSAGCANPVLNDGVPSVMTTDEGGRGERKEGGSERSLSSVDELGKESEETQVDVKR